MNLSNPAYRLYYKMPPWLQDSVVSGYGYYTRRTRYGARYREHLRALLDSDYAPAEQRERLRRDRLADVLQAAAAHVPFYRERLPAGRVGERARDPLAALSHFPVIDKRQVREASVSIVDERIAPRSLSIAYTSGSSGQPLHVYRSADSVAFQWAVWARHKHRFGVVQHRDRHVTFGAKPVMLAERTQPPFWRVNAAFRQTYISPGHLGGGFLEPIARLLEREAFTYYVGYPTNMAVVARYMLDRDIAPRHPPRAVFSGSDTLTADMRALLAEAFGAPVSEQYGMAEAAGNFAECELGHLHLDGEFGYAEYLDLPDDPTSDVKRLVLTGFSNAAAPLIRYEVGDLAIPASGACACGRSSPRIAKLVGRTDDYIVTPDGRYVQGMNQVLEWADRTYETQLLQTAPAQLIVNVIPKLGFDPQRDCGVLIRELRKRVGADVRVDVREVEELQRTPTGKARAVISELGARA